MTKLTTPKWLEWTQQLQALAQTGLAYADSQFDIERYEAIRHIAADILAEHSEVSTQKIERLFTDQTGYATPKIDVRGVVFQDDCILLVKEKSDGLWTLPGGWADVTDSAAESVEREVIEESGYRVKATKLLAVYDKNKHRHPPALFRTYKFFFLCHLIDGAPTNSHETEDATFFEEHALPPLSLQRVLPAQIQRMFEHYRHPDWPTDFD